MYGAHKLRLCRSVLTGLTTSPSSLKPSWILLVFTATDIEVKFFKWMTYLGIFGTITTDVSIE